MRIMLQTLARKFPRACRVVGSDRTSKYPLFLLLFTAMLLAGSRTAMAQYCTPSANSGTYYISNFTTTGAAVNVNNTSGGGTGVGYTDFTNTQNVTAMQSTVVNFSATGGGGGTYVWRIYVDWNQNNIFDAAELMFTNGTSYVGSVSGSFTVPVSALSGITRMRVFADYWSSTGAPCTFSTTGPTGEAEDYSFTVGALPPCTGLPAAGTILATPATVCGGTTSNLSLAGAAVASGLAYQWQDSSIVAGTWQNIAGATLRGYTTVPLTTGRYYRAKVICSATNDTAYTPAKLVSVALATVPYFETFESITANNQLPNCMSATSIGTNNRTYTSTYTGNQTNHTPGGSKYGLFYYFPAGQSGFFTPALTLTGGTTYLLKYWYIGYNAAGTGITTLSAMFGNAPNVGGMTTLIGAVTPNNTTYQQFSQTFTPATSGTYFVGIVSTSTASGSNYYVSIDDIGIDSLTPCSGRPSAGVVTAPTPCPSIPFTLTRNGGTNANLVGNINYQWQDSTSTGWQNSIGATAVSSAYTTAISVPTKYRVILTCTTSGQKDTSASYMVNLASFLTCYCNTSIPTYTADDDIGNVTIKSVPNNTVLLNNGVGTPLLNNPTSVNTYTNFTALPPTPLYRDSTYNINLTQINSGSFYTCLGYAYIDYNHNGIFDANELILNRTTSTSSTPSQQVNQNFTIPTSALIGVTRMRVILNESATSPDPCIGYYYGETEDYYVNVSYPPCNGPTNAGAAMATTNTICKGYTVDVWDTTHEYRRSLISWNWQNSVDGGLTWNTVPGSTGKDTLNNILITGPVSYRLKMMCNGSGDSTFSTPADITIKAPYECYCYSQSNGGITDTSDIGAIVIGAMVNTTGGPHIYNPVAIKKRTDYTSIPNIVMDANRKYHLSIYHTQRNGIHADARVSVFIDYNNNLQYDVNAQPNSELVFSGITTESNFYLDTVINVPDAVIPNVPTGLRVILNNDLNPNSPANLGCGPYVSGETEDYVVQFRRVPAGVNNVMNLETVSLYPNPTNGKFMISATGMKAMDQVSVSVTTIAGQQMLRKSYSNVGNKFSEELDLTEAARGIYFVEIRTANGDKMIRKLSVK